MNTVSDGHRSLATLTSGQIVTMAFRITGCFRIVRRAIRHSGRASVRHFGFTRSSGRSTAMMQGTPTKPAGSATPPGAALAHLLVVEDEPSIAGFVRRGLIFEGYSVDVAENGRVALDILRNHPPDLLILDLMLPEIDGMEVARRIRAAEDADNLPCLPILMLTARDAVVDRIAGLDVGADDYLVKPFDFDELLARIRALLRRSSHGEPRQASETLAFADVTMQIGSRTVTRSGRQIELTVREFDLLALFLRHPNQVLTRSTLMERVWGEDFFGESNVLEVVIGNLRRSLEVDNMPRLIQTVRGVGYVLRQNG